MAKYAHPTAYSAWGPEEQAAIARVHASGFYTQGPEVAAFELEFAEHHGRKHGVYVNSGSSANLIAVAALTHLKDNPLRPGDGVDVPALAWATTYAPLAQHGLSLHILGSDDTWNAPASVEDGCDLLVTVPVLGNPCYYLQHERRRPRYWIDDCCESLGAWVGSLGEKRLAGTFADMSTFSFFHSHQLSGIEGGMVLTDSDELNGLLRMLRDHGMTRYSRPEGFDREYDFRLFGYNVRGLELHAAISREQLKKLEGFRRHREQNLNNFVAATYGLAVEFPRRNGVVSPFGLNFRVESHALRARLALALRAEGIDCRPPTGGSFTLHRYGRKWREANPTPHADMLHVCGLFLGNAPYPMLPEIEKAAGVMRRTL